RIIDLIYWRNGKLPDNDRLLCRWLECNARTWKRLKASLVACGKICVQDGYIVNNRASLELETRKVSELNGQTLTIFPPNSQQENNKNSDLKSYQQGHTQIPRYPEGNTTPRGEGFKNDDGVGVGEVKAMLTPETLAILELILIGLDMDVFFHRYVEHLKKN